MVTKKILSHDTGGIGSPFERISEKRIPVIGDLPESLVDITHQLAAQPGQVIPFTHAGERWFGSVRESGCAKPVRKSGC